MTEIELEVLRLRLRIEAHQKLLTGIYTWLASSSPIAAKVIQDQFAKLREGHLALVIPGLPPATSDMIAAEFQSALDDVLREIEGNIRTRSAP